MSLDDLIKSDKSLQKSKRDNNPKKSRGGGGAGNRGRNRGGRRFDSPNRRGGGSGRNRGGGNRGQRYENFNRRSRSRSRSPLTWQHDKYRGPMPAGYERASSRLLVSNLDFGVDDRDMRELFASFGSLVECRVLYERSGRSTDTAEITFD